ncbi:MAG: hypothetical protein IPL70_06010 [Uliginosibacterium sp.]|nr:hypothetical protein [Uliginosibacterium sp.]
MDQEYRIVFNGRIREGLSMRKVRANAAVRLNASDELIERMFSGRRVVLKNKVSKAEAVAYMERLAKLGLVVELEPMPSPKGTATVQTPIAAGFVVISPPAVRRTARRAPAEESWLTGTCLADLARTHLNLDRAEALLNGCGMGSPQPERRTRTVDSGALTEQPATARPRGRSAL